MLGFAKRVTASMDDDRVLVCVSDFYAKCMRHDSRGLDANCILVVGGKTIAGCDAVREPQKVRARIGFLSTGTALYGRLTAREMVEGIQRSGTG